MDNNNYKQKLVFFLRHGDRGDLSTEPHEQQRLEKQHDCHLTDLGCFQAQLAGEKVAQMIKEQNPNIKQLKLVSSPLLRCLMTTENFVKGAGIKILNDEVQVENCIGELLLTFLFDHCPYKDGLMLRQYPEKVVKEYVKDIKIIDQNPKNDIPEFPEGDEEHQCYDRIFDGFKKVTQEFFEKVDSGELKDTALVILTHGGVVAGILSKLGIFDQDIGFQLTNINGFLYENSEQEKLVEMPKVLTKQNYEHLDKAQQLYDNYMRERKQQ